MKKHGKKEKRAESCFSASLLLRLGLLGRHRLGHARAEAVEEVAVDLAEVAAAAGADGATAVRLGRPVVVAHAAVGVAARRAALLLVVERALAAADAHRVRLHFARTKASRTLRHLPSRAKQQQKTQNKNTKKKKTRRKKRNEKKTKSLLEDERCPLN